MSGEQRGAEKITDVVLVGGGIMSATLGSLLRELQPDWTIEVFERLKDTAMESSHVSNNAGTGHSAYCELNYTTERADGTIDISKALKVNESFEVSRQYWSHLVEKGCFSSPQEFITSVPHISFVRGARDVAFLKKRHEALCRHPLFEGMEYTEDHKQMAEWMPLVMAGRECGETVAATRSLQGTDVNFGALTHGLFAFMQRSEKVRLRTRHEVLTLRRGQGGLWELKVKDLHTGEVFPVRARRVFLGAGGRALTLLLKSGIPEGRGYGGFPVSGMWLYCSNREVIEKHHAKVYGKAQVGTPPMSVPHLDTRRMAGQKALLFGPYAGFSTRFLKTGSYLDLPLSVRPGNFVPLLMSAGTNFGLVRYLIQQVLQSPRDRFRALEEYYPEAQSRDWSLRVAGQRVQIIHKDPKTGTYLQFGTEVVHSADGTLSALLGASPGASTSVAISLELLERCYPAFFRSGPWPERLAGMVPTFGKSLPEDPELCRKVRRSTSEVLGLPR